MRPLWSSIVLLSAVPSSTLHTLFCPRPRTGRRGSVRWQRRQGSPGRVPTTTSGPGKISSVPSSKTCSRAGNDKIVEAMAGADDPVWAYVEANLQLVADGEHAIVGALATLTPQTFRDSRIMEMHDSLVLPLVEALRLRGVSDPKLTAKLINSLVHTGTELIESGCSMDEVRSAVREVLA